jgi:RimJ/RimL family protein N-acetyltransferase
MAAGSVEKAPEVLRTERLALRRPTVADADEIFARYASDPEVTVYLAWPRHRQVEDTNVFLAFSDAEWRRWPAGPYLILDRADDRLLGSTGLSFDSARVASTGYVLAQDAWGRGYATEVLQAMVALAPRLGVGRLYALCHPAHAASARVLTKGGFTYDGRLARFAPFPNLHGTEPVDVDRYALEFDR